MPEGLFVGVCSIDTSHSSDSNAYVDEETIYREFGKRVAVRRRELRMTQKDLSGRIGLTRASVANIERGQQKLPLHQVYRIAYHLGLSTPADLLPAFGDELASGAFLALSRTSEALNSSELAQVTKLYEEMGIARP